MCCSVYCVRSLDHSLKFRLTFQRELRRVVPRYIFSFTTQLCPFPHDTTASSLSHFVVIPTRTHKHSCQTTTHTRARFIPNAFCEHSLSLLFPLRSLISPNTDRGARSQRPQRLQAPTSTPVKIATLVNALPPRCQLPNPEASHGHPT